MNSHSVFSQVIKQLNWEIGYHENENESPTQWMPATVPGAVQLDVMKAENYKQPYWYGNNVEQFDWMETSFFTYKSNFKKPAIAEFQRLHFFSKGIDYEFKIYLNNELLLEQEGMFTYIDLDLSAYLQEDNELKIVVMPIPSIGVPYEKGTETYRQNARESAKPAVSYGWDWHPRLVTRGIWDETGLTIRKENRITDASVEYQLNDDLTSVDVQLNLEISEPTEKRFKWFLKDPFGKIVLETEGETNTLFHHQRVTLEEPLLWWPSGYGQPNLYTSEVHLFDQSQSLIDHTSTKVGFRKIKLIMNEGGWEHDGFPTTRSVAPASLEVNNKRIFAKGSNWVHPEIFIGTITEARYREQILLAKNANFNMLRVWGGGIVNKESFFDICDELGILVWQEFPLACNDYTDDEKYLKVLEQEARSIVKRVKNHASLAIWSGGNELFNSWSGMTEQSLALRLLNSICYELDPKTPFIYTSPLYGMAHGHYLFYDPSTDEEVFQWMSRAKNTAYTEFATPGVANLSVLKRFMPDDELFPPRLGTAWESHHGFGAWQENSWLELPTLERYFGKMESLEELVGYSQLLQGESLKFIYEEARRQKPYASMALNWCFQEPWPTAANNSLINWPNEVKPAYHQVADACRQVLASVRIPKFTWKEGEEFSCELYLLNDSYEEIEKAEIVVELSYDGGKSILLGEWEFPGANEFENVKGPTFKVPIPDMESDLFSVNVRVKGKSEYDSAYVILNSSDRTPTQKIDPLSFYRVGENY